MSDGKFTVSEALDCVLVDLGDQTIRLYPEAARRIAGALDRAACSVQRRIGAERPAVHNHPPPKAPPRGWS